MKAKLPKPTSPEGNTSGANRRSWHRTLWRIVHLSLIIYVLLVVMMMFLEESLIYFPFNSKYDDWHPVSLPFEDVLFTAADGTKLHGWYVPHENARAIVLFCHGNGGNLSHRIDMLQILHRHVGASVMIFDYRGYGRSEGKPNETGVLLDARAARAWLVERENIDEKEIVMMGRSLGGAVAIDLATRDGARGLVLESTFTSLPDVAAYHYPWLPIRMLIRTRFDSFGKITEYHGPLLQSHGEADTIVPIRFGRQLFEAANEPKQFISFPGDDHNNLPPMEYYDALERFFDEL